MKAALCEYPGGGLDDLWRAPALANVSPDRRQGDYIHPIARFWLNRVPAPHCSRHIRLNETIVLCHPADLNSIY
jgi:hypothetical protein